MALGIYDMKWPPFAADITLELHQHQETNKPFVKVSYIGQVGDENESVYLISFCIFPPVVFYFKLVISF